MTSLLELTNITRCYPSVEGEGEVEILKRVSLKIDAGEMVAIMGASGSGKTTLMNIIGCLDTPSSGSYLVNGVDVGALEADMLAQLRREYFGFVFQSYHLIPYLTAKQNVEIPAIYAHISKEERHKSSHDILKILGLSARADYSPSKLSGGQQQRVSIGRALINGGAVILADEPTGALDEKSSEGVLALLKKFNTLGHTVILVTHDANVASQAARIIEIHEGTIVNNTHTEAKLPAGGTLKPIEFSRYGWRELCRSLYQSMLIALLAINASKLRSLLAMMGIIIGIASVVSIVMIGDTAKQRVLADIRSIGTNTINIYPGRDFGDDDPSSVQSLNNNDLMIIQQQEGVSSVTPSLSKSFHLRYGPTDVLSNVEGVGSQYFSVYGIPVKQGNRFNDVQIQSQSQVVIIDNNTRKVLFPHTRNVIGKVIFIGEMPVKVIGVSEDASSIFGSSKLLHVWLPYSTMAERLIGQRWFNSITVRIKDGYDSAEFEQELTRLLSLSHGRKDFFTLNMDKVLKAAEKSAHTLQIFLTLVAVISLIVGAIGVMNIMLFSVSERRREIGIRMAVGARALDVQFQFLIEAIFICLIGGFLGIVLSLIIAFVVPVFLVGWVIEVSPTMLLIAVSCSLVTGIVSGWFPARKAANLNPVDALKSE